MSNPALEEAIRKRNEFLNEHPEMLQLQYKIDLTLEGLSPEDRLTVINKLMEQSYTQLMMKMEDLMKYVRSSQVMENIEKITKELT